MRKEARPAWLLVVVGEREQPFREGVEVSEVAGLREVDLGLAEAAGVDRRVHEDEIGSGALEAVDRALAAAGGAVVDDRQHALCGRRRALG